MGGSEIEKFSDSTRRQFYFEKLFLFDVSLKIMRVLYFMSKYHKFCKHNECEISADFPHIFGT